MSISIASRRNRQPRRRFRPASLPRPCRWPSSPAAGKSDEARWLVGLPADVIRARAAILDLARGRALVPDGLVAGGMVDVACGGRRLPTYLDAQSLATVAIVPPSCAPVAISTEVPGTVRVPLSSGETIVRVPSAEGHFAEGVRVDARQALTVREIIARHQAAAARQRRAVQQLISTGTMTLTFEAPAFPAPMAITSQVSIYTAADATDIEQRDIRVNGIAFAGGRVPRLPLIEPERVASPPLAIALTDLYTYRLAGEDTVAGVRCYAVAFTPVDRKRALFSGTAWIASGQLRDGQSLGSANGTARADRLVGADRRVQPGRGRSLAAGPLGGPSALRGRRLPHSDPSRARHRSSRREPSGLHRAPAPGVRVGRGDAARHAAGISLPAPRAGTGNREWLDARHRSRRPSGSASGAGIAARPHGGAGRHRRSQHQHAAAVCRSQLRRLQSV